MAFDVRGRGAVRTDFPYEIVKLENVFIPLKCGQRLAANIWMPKGVEPKSLGTIVEYLPYRKNDFTSMRDSVRHTYLASSGFASIRVDIRGAGDSDGALKDEYLKQEQDDALELFDWIVAQNWSNGSIGIFGKSWGGFNGLQIAYRQHPALKAIITLCSTDDRYADDVHYRGGAMMASDMLWWASTMFAFNARPQDPDVHKDWRANWLERLDTEPNVVEWVKHQRRDQYWKHGSVCEDFSKVNIPVMAVGGWKDGYTNAVFRLVENLPDCVGLVGPWVHDFPEVGTPEPSIGFLQIHVDWWKKHLMGQGPGWTGPKLALYVQDSAKPADLYDYRPGRFESVPSWPSPNVSGSKLYLGKNMMLSSTCSDDKHLITGTQDYGLYRGQWCPFGQKGDFATDQRLENAKSVVFTSDQFDKDVVLMGNPKVRVQVSADKPNAILSARLCEKFPTGESTLLSWGMLNLSHRASHESPEALVPGKVYDIEISLDALGQTIKAGNKLELALSPTDWPQAWPLPETAELTVFAGPDTYLELPVRASSKPGAELTFQQPEIYKEMAKINITPADRTREVRHDVVNDVWTLEDYNDGGERLLLDHNRTYMMTNRTVWSIKTDDPLSATNTCDWTLSVGKGNDFYVFLDTSSTMTADATHYHLENTLVAYEGKVRKEVFRKTWKNSIERDFC